MRVLISLDAELLRDADCAAKEIGISRSGLIDIALRDFLEKRRKKEVRRELNDVYGSVSHFSSKPIVRTLKNKLRIEDAW